MVLPKNYVSINSTEMEYVDGGWNGWWNSTKVIGIVIDAAISLVPAVMAFSNLLKAGKLAAAGRVYVRTNIDILLRKAKISLATSMLSGVVNILCTAIGSSIGSLIAEAIDSLDGDNNGHCFG